eukprot:795807-Rhodomonas_salina.1
MPALCRECASTSMQHGGEEGGAATKIYSFDSDGTLVLMCRAVKRVDANHETHVTQVNLSDHVRHKLPESLQTHMAHVAVMLLTHEDVFATNFTPGHTPIPPVMSADITLLILTSFQYTGATVFAVLQKSYMGARLMFYGTDHYNGTSVGTVSKTFSNRYMHNSAPAEKIRHVIGNGLEWAKKWNNEYFIRVFNAVSEMVTAGTIDSWSIRKCHSG